MLHTRHFLMMLAAILAMALPVHGTGDDGLLIGDDGLHKQTWFHDSFLEFGDDLAEAAEQGKHLMVIIEQDGCPCCRELHRVNFAKPEITDFIQEHYVVVQLDLYGSRGTVDFDGEEMEERDLVLKWGAQFTPTTIIFAAANTGAKSRAEAEVFRLPGYLRPFHYLTSLEYVVSGEYRNMDFQRFLGVKVKDLQERGIQPEIWE